MTVAASIILAAILGGVIFVLLDSWQRRADAPVPIVDPEPVYRPEPPRPTWELTRASRKARRTASGPAGPAAAKAPPLPRSPSHGGGRCRSSRRGR